MKRVRVLLRDYHHLICTTTLQIQHEHQRTLPQSIDLRNRTLLVDLDEKDIFLVVDLELHLPDNLWIRQELVGVRKTTIKLMSKNYFVVVLGHFGLT